MGKDYALVAVTMTKLYHIKGQITWWRKAGQIDRKKLVEANLDLPTNHIGYLNNKRLNIKRPVIPH